MIFHFKIAENLVAEHYERDFELIFPFNFKGSSKLRCRALWNRFWHDFPLYWQLKSWLQSTLKESLTCFFHLRRLKISLQSTMKKILTWFSTLWRLKSLLQITMNEDRLTWLALMTMNKNRFTLDDAVLDNFTRKKTRRLNLILEKVYTIFT